MGPKCKCKTTKLVDVNGTATKLLDINWQKHQKCKLLNVKGPSNAKLINVNVPSNTSAKLIK